MFNIAVIRPIGHNVGNHAIYFAVKQQLYQAFGRLVNIIEIPASSKHESTAKSGLSKQTVYELNRLADGVIVGGGNLYENNEIDVDQTALEALQPPLMLFSNSFGRVYDRFGNLNSRSDGIPMQKLSKLVEQADISASRDSFTNSTVQKLGFKDDFGYCPTMNLSAYAGKFENKLPAGESVGAFISIRAPNLMNVPASYQSDVYNQLDTAILTLKENFDRVRILCNDSRDVDFALNFRDKRKVDPYYTNDVYEYLALLKNSDFVISYRLHATLPCVSFKTPVLNLSYDERAQCLLDDLKLQSINVNIVEERENVIPRIQNISNRNDSSYKIEDHIYQHWASIIVHQQTLFEKFTGLVKRYQSGV